MFNTKAWVVVGKRDKKVKNFSWIGATKSEAINNFLQDTDRFNWEKAKSDFKIVRINIEVLPKWAE